MNQAIISGNVGRAEFKETPSGEGLLKFSVATSERYKDKSGETKEQTEWHSCVMFGKRAAALRNLVQKGVGLIITGKIEYRKYTDKNGIEKSTTQILVDQLHIYKYAQPAAEGVAEAPKFESKFTEDDLPF